MSLPMSPEQKEVRGAAAPHERRPGVAMSLSMLCCGLGQIYCGDAGRGLILFSSCLLLGPTVVATATRASSTLMLTLFLASLFSVIGISVWSIGDARRRACALRGRAFVPRDYNRPAVYVLMAMTGLPYALGLALFVRANVIEAFKIPTASMSPTLVPGDRILVTKIGLEDRTLQRGDVVVFRNPEDRRQRYVKRVIGLPGETVEIRDGRVLIDGRPLPVEPASQDPPGNSTVPGEVPAGAGTRKTERAGDTEYAILDDPQERRAEEHLGDSPPLKIPPWSYFVLGDHRSRSRDSRAFGPVAHGEIVGVVSYIYWPGDIWSRFGPASLRKSRETSRSN